MHRPSAGRDRRCMDKVLGEIEDSWTKCLER